MNHRTIFASIATVGALALAGCASSTAPTVAPATVAPTAAAPTAAPATAAPTAAPTVTPTFGLGDTTANPDSTFEDAASASIGGSVVAYATIAGSDQTTADSLLTVLTKGGSWVSINTIPGGSLYAVPGCHLTSADGLTTVRVYTAVAGSAADTSVICNSLSGA